MVDESAIPDEPDGETLDLLSMFPEDVGTLATMYAGSAEAVLREAGEGDLVVGVERTLARLHERGLVQPYPAEAGVWELSRDGRRETDRRRADPGL